MTCGKEYGTIVALKHHCKLKHPQPMEESHPEESKQNSDKNMEKLEEKNEETNLMQGEGAAIL